MRGQPDNLTPYYDIAQEQAGRLGLSAGWEQHTIVDGSVPHTHQYMSSILDAIDAALGNGKTIYLHCLGGVGRTGTVVGCWLVRHGHTGDAALDRIAELFGASGLATKHHHSSPETREQREYGPQLDRAVVGTPASRLPLRNPGGRDVQRASVKDGLKAECSWMY